MSDGGGVRRSRGVRGTRRRWGDLGAMVRATRGRCPACGTPMFDGPYRLRRVCSGCGVRFERDTGSWLGASVLSYIVAILVLAAEAGVLLPRYGLFRGIEVVAIASGTAAVLLSYRPAKGWWVWWMWAAGFVTRDGTRDGDTGDGAAEEPDTPS